MQFADQGFRPQALNLQTITAGFGMGDLQHVVQVQQLPFFAKLRTQGGQFQSAIEHQAYEFEAQRLADNVCHHLQDRGGNTVVVRGHRQNDGQVRYGVSQIGQQHVHVKQRE